MIIAIFIQVNYIIYMNCANNHHKRIPLALGAQAVASLMQVI